MKCITSNILINRNPYKHNYVVICMVNKNNYTLSLDKDVVDKARKIMDEKGYKLSPLVNIFLKDWVSKNEN